MPDLNRNQGIGLVLLALGVTGFTAYMALGSSRPPGPIVLRTAPAAPPASTLSAGRPAAGGGSARRITRVLNSDVPDSPPARLPGETAADTGDQAPPQEPARQDVVVHVVGAVRSPGVYHLKPGARGEDALHAAGGPRSAANLAAVNLAAPLADGTQLYFPTRREAPVDHVVDAGPRPEPGAPPSAGLSYVPTRGGSASGRAGKSAKLTDPSEGTVNINAASAEELQRLPGIGPSMAQRVLAYRKENGAFHAIDDLRSVGGIGDRKIEKLRPFVRLR